MYSLPVLPCHGLLDVHIEAVDRSTAIEGRRFPQQHQGTVTHLQHMEIMRSTWRDRQVERATMGSTGRDRQVEVTVLYIRS